MRPPDILLKDEEAIPCDSDASQYLSLISSVMGLGYQRAEVHKVVPQTDILCCHLDCRLGDVVPRLAGS